jgi:hypothetical protein
MTTHVVSWIADLQRRLLAFVREHTTLAITLGYVFLTIVGATFEFFLYLRFRVNVLQFAEPLDFVFAAIRHPLVILFAALPLAVLWLIEVVDVAIRRVFPAYGRSFERSERTNWYPTLRRMTYPVFVVIYFVYFTIQYSNYTADRLAAGHGRPVTVDLNAASGGDPKRLEGILIGTTLRYVFVYQLADSSTHVVPTESIVEMLVHRRPKESARR